LTPAEAADYAAVTERQMRGLLQERKIQPTYVGKHVRVHIDDLEAYLKTRRGAR